MFCAPISTYAESNPAPVVSEEMLHLSYTELELQFSPTCLHDSESDATST